MKPSQIKIMKAKKTRFLLPGFRGITWKGTIYCKQQSDVDEINKSDEIDSTFKSHEMIHLRQAQSMKDSWLRYYLNYVGSWIRNMPLIVISTNAPYKLIPTEIEAYLNQDDRSYAKEVKPLTQWKEFKKLTTKEKRQIAKVYYKLYNRRKSYTSVLKEFFDNE